MKPIVSKLGVGAILVGSGGFAGAALNASGPSPGQAAAPSRTAPVEVRTEVIHRTVRVVRHERPRHHAAAPASPAAPPPAATPVTATPVRAAIITPARAAPAPAVPQAPRLKTRTSGGGRTAGGEHEHEGGSDD